MKANMQVKIVQSFVFLLHAFDFIVVVFQLLLHLVKLILSSLDFRLGRG